MDVTVSNFVQTSKSPLLVWFGPLDVGMPVWQFPKAMNKSRPIPIYKSPLKRRRYGIWKNGRLPPQASD